MKPLSEIEFKEIQRKKLNWLEEQSIKIKLDLMQNHLSLCQIMLNELLEEEVIERAGERYSRNKPHGGRYSRWGYNTGSVRIGDNKMKMDIPRVMDTEKGKNVPLERYEDLKEVTAPTDQLLKGILMGLSMRDYDQVVDYLGEGFGLSKSQVSRSFKERTMEQLEQFQSRSLEHHDFVCLFIDGKYLAKEQIIIALGVTMTGEKIPLDFVQAHSEAAQPIQIMLDQLKERGLKYDQGLLVVIDGSKGLKKAVEQSFPDKIVIQRCRWHKRENILSYLPEKDKPAIKRRYDQALAQQKHADAKADLKQLIKELEHINVSAARSLSEGMEEILTLHRLNLNLIFDRNFATTNCIESLNSQLSKYLGKVKYWKNSMQRYRWVGTALLEIETKMHRVHNYKKLDLMRKAIIFDLNKQNSLHISTENGT